MDFEKAAKLGNYISKNFAKDVFRLLINYKSISASEAASRLGLHIQTVQDFLEAISDLQIVKKVQVNEGKRPYFRYHIHNTKINFELDLEKEFGNSNTDWIECIKIREMKNAGIHFTLARNGQNFSSVTIWLGKSRNRKEKKINLTKAQGLFLYNLPFPDGQHLSIQEIADKALITNENIGEIKDLINEMIQYKVLDYI